MKLQAVKYSTDFLGTKWNQSKLKHFKQAIKFS